MNNITNFKKPRIIFLGFSDVGFQSLKFLIEYGCNIVAVFTHDTDPHEEKWFETPESLAIKNNIPVYKPLSLKDEKWATLVSTLNPDLILSLYYRNFIPPQIFNQAKLGAYNMHGSYLPKYRGRAPLNWSIINGENYCGASLHVLEKDFDTGDIVCQEKVSIDNNEYVETVIPRITDAVIKILKNSIDSLLSGRPNLTKQNHNESTYFGKRSPKDGQIDFSKTATEVFNLIRAISHPFPGAFFFRNDNKIIIWKARIGHEINGESSGTIVSEAPLTIACKDRYLFVDEYSQTSIDPSIR